MDCYLSHPVEQISDHDLRDLLMRVDVTGFPADLDHLWHGERVRYRETLRRIPPADAIAASASAANDSAYTDNDSVPNDLPVLLDQGSSRPWIPFFQELLGYQRMVLNTFAPDSGFVDKGIKIRNAKTTADLSVSVFDVERDRFPHDDNSFDVVLCLEVVEHLAIDPMAMMSEVNRVLKPDGLFVLTTPNAVRYRNVVNSLLGEHPMGWSPYNGIDTNRHNREYTPEEMTQLFSAAGLTPSEVTTFGSTKLTLRRKLLKWLIAAATLPITRCPPRWRNDVIIAVGRKTSPVIDRRPAWLYFDAAEHLNTPNTTLPSNTLPEAVCV